MAVTPPAELSELLHLLVQVLDVILDGEPIGIIHPDVTTKSEEDTRCFEGDEAGV